MKMMPKIVLLISLQIDNSIHWNLWQNKPCWGMFSSYQYQPISMSIKKVSRYGYFQYSVNCIRRIKTLLHERGKKWGGAHLIFVRSSSKTKAELGEDSSEKILSNNHYLTFGTGWLIRFETSLIKKEMSTEQELLITESNFH